MTGGVRIARLVHDGWRSDGFERRGIQGLFPKSDVEVEIGHLAQVLGSSGYDHFIWEADSFLEMERQDPA